MFSHIFLLTLAPLILVESVNYCYLPCTNTIHSACKKCGVDEKCMNTEYFEYPVKKEDRETILNLHNVLRNEIASGRKYFTFQKITIADMHVVDYSSELEHLALCWIRRCRRKADPCPRTEQYPNVKQNIYETVPNLLWGCSYSTMIKEALSRWWNDFQVSRFNLLSCIDSHNCTGNLNQVLWSNTVYVGCAMVKYESRTAKCLLACNYAPGYVTGPLFNLGPVGMKCGQKKSGFDALCGSSTVSEAIPNKPRVTVLCYLILFLYVIENTKIVLLQ